jgi:cbb3-type cytochrome oxidase subunit 3
MNAIGLPQLALILVAILVIWSIYRPRGPLSR